MTDDNENDDKPDYEVGYGKPPEHSRFQKGQSGNMNGRPKDKQPKSGKRAGQALSDFLSELVQMKVNGKKREVTRMEALIMVHYQKAIEGDMRAARLIGDLIRQLKLFDPNKNMEPSAVLVVPADVLEEEWAKKTAERQRPYREGRNIPPRHGKGGDPAPN